MTRRGAFIVFEGGEGVGKSTQVGLLVAHLHATRPELRIVQSREPGGTPAAEALRRVALDKDFVGLAPRAEALVFAAARGDHVYQVIRPALEQGACVIVDRYIDSSVVYQGLARGLGADEVERLSMWATESLLPDLVILLDLDPRSGLERITAPDRLESEGLEFHVAVREGFLARAAAHPDRFTVIDASASVDVVAAAVAAAVDQVLDGR
ncbi:MAG: dTMP kinase [Actinobacteria bacterium]|nr:dTMP kinase [Actinomycetota bacterium]